jgi:antitoxin PrlF
MCPTDILEAESTLTDKYQTTVPSAVRKALNLSKRDRIRFEIREDQVILKRAASEEDPALASFLAFLEQDIAAGNAAAVDGALMAEIDALTAGVTVDLDEALDSTND